MDVAVFFTIFVAGFGLAIQLVNMVINLIDYRSKKK